MGLSAESVTVAIEAKTEALEQPINRAKATMTDFQSHTEKSAGAVEVAIARSSNNGGQALMILEGITRRTADQFVAGAPPATILAEHIAGLAEAAEFAGGPMNLLEVAISGGLGLAVTAVLPLLISFGSELLGVGEHAEAADTGLKAFQDRQSDMARFIDQTNGRLREQNRLLAEVGVGDKGAQAAKSNSDANAYVNQAFETARTALTTAPGQGGRTGPTGVALELSRAILDAGSNVQALRRNIDALSGGGEVIETLKGKVGDLAGRAAESAKQAQSYGYQQNTLNASLRGAVEITLGVVESQARHATATTALARAQANLADVEARKQSIEKMDDGPEKTAAILQYGRDQIAATQAVQSATEAEKQHRQGLADSKRAAAEAEAQAMLLAAAHAKLATATTETERAEAQLAIVQAQRKSFSASEYQAALTQAEGNVKLAKSLDEITRATAGVNAEIGKRSESGFAAFDSAAGYRRETGDRTVGDALDTAYSLDKGRKDQTSENFNNQLQRQEQGVRTLASLYQGLFENGTKGLWDNFEKLGEQAIAKLAAQKTFELIGNLISGSSGGGVGGLLSGIFGGTPHSDTGGVFQVGGNAGIDQNTLSINGRPISKVSSSETIAVIPKAQRLAQQGAVSGSGQTIVNQSFTLDARYGITSSELIDHVNQTAARAAVLGAHGGGELGYQKVMTAGQRPMLPRSTG